MEIMEQHPAQSAWRSVGKPRCHLQSGAHRAGKYSLTPVAHLEFVNQTMTAEFNSATELLPLPAGAQEQTVRINLELRILALEFSP